MTPDDRLTAPKQVPKQVENETPATSTSAVPDAEADAEPRTAIAARQNQATKWLAHRLSPYAVLWITAALGGILALGLTIASAAVYDAVTDKDGVSVLDRPALDQVISWRNPVVDQILTGFTHLGGVIGMTIIASAITLAMVWRWRTPTPLILMVIAVAGSLLFTTVGKAIVGRQRPPLSDAVPPYEYAFSFPSGHTLNSTVIAGMVAYLIGRRLHTQLGRILCVTAAVVWAGAIGFSRVFLGHHWLTDVMFGWLLGLAWLTLLITAHRIFLAVRRMRTGSRPHAIEDPQPTAE